MSATHPLVIQGKCYVEKTFKGNNVRSEPEGGENEGDAGELVPGRQIKLFGLELNEQQFDALVGNHAWRCHFNTAPEKFAEMLFPEAYSRLPLDGQHKNCSCEIRFGIDGYLKFDPVSLKNLLLKFKNNQLPRLSLSFVGPRPRSMDLFALEEHASADRAVDVTLTFGRVAKDTEQGELPLQTSAPVEKTRILEPGQAEQEAETQRQLGQALRGLDEQQQSAA